MSFDERIAVLVQRIPSLVDHLETEEATKNALVLPFIAALGYDIFNPQEVVPEFTADVGTKKGEKVDYAILQDSEVTLIFECKKFGTNLSIENVSQLYRYFSVTKARIAVLTDGVQYQFFSDLDAPNKMDEKPFLELDLGEPRKNALQEVKKLARDDFDLEKILSTANDLKYTSEIQKVFAAQFEAPDEEFVRFFFARVSPNSKFINSAKEQFTGFVSKAFQQFVSEKVSGRLKTALQSEAVEVQIKHSNPEEQEAEDLNLDGIITTEEELEGYRIIRAIVCKSVDPNRVTHRDTKTYMGILLDDNNRKPICRLWFNTRQKYIGIFDESKKETRKPIDDLSQIYQFSEELNTTVLNYISSN
ncbi:MAG: restriction endonuclease [Oscillatoriales cyanobacterium]|nr:MAG: restriction endonuclease [Oscillatoriales cyanobacterium]